MVECKNKRSRGEAEDLLEEHFKASLSKSENPVNCIRKETDSLVNKITENPTVTVISVKRGCIILSLRTSTIHGLLYVIQLFESQRFRSILDSLSAELYYLYGEAFLLQGHIPLECLNRIQQKFKFSDSRETKQHKGVSLQIQCTSMEGFEHVLSVAGAESSTKSLIDISDMISKEIKEPISVAVEPDMLPIDDVLKMEEIFEKSDTHLSPWIKSVDKNVPEMYVDDTISEMGHRQKLTLNQAQNTQCMKSTIEVFESNLLFELLLSQKEAARFLELAYLALREDPGKARQVRMTANDCENQHSKTNGLVREYEGTAIHMVKTMLPIIELGIKKKKEMLVIKGLDKVLDYVDDMVKKTKDTIQEYYNIKTAVNDEISDIDKKNKDIKIRKSEISSEMQRNRLKLELEKKEVINLETENKEKEKELQKLKSKRLKFIGDSVQTDGPMDFIKELFTASMATIGGCIGGAETGKMIFDGVRTATTTRKDQVSQQALNTSAETKRNIDEEQRRIEENERRIARMKEEAIEGLAAMERLALENADLMIEESLKMAGAELGKVAQLFGTILLFWEDFSAKLTKLKNTHDGVKLLIEFVNDPDLAEDIDDSVLQVKKVWNSFGIMCSYYVSESVEQLPELYAFMGAPVDQSSVQECDERKKALLAAHKADIRALEKKII